VNLFRDQKVKGQGHRVTKCKSIAASCFYSLCTRIYVEGGYWNSHAQQPSNVAVPLHALPPIDSTKAGDKWLVREFALYRVSRSSISSASVITIHSMVVSLINQNSGDATHCPTKRNRRSCVGALEVARSGVLIVLQDDVTESSRAQRRRLSTDGAASLRNSKLLFTATRTACQTYTSWRISFAAVSLL